MSLLVEELVNGRRIVVTNLPVKLPELNEYLQVTYPTANIVLNERLVLMNEDQLSNFYKYRAPDSSLDLVTDEKGRAIRCDYSKVSPNDCGVFYILDELHIAFNSRAWMNTGAAAIYYLSQHRKLGDDVICITQSTANVDKQFRSVAQEFHQLRNLSKETWGYFRGPQKFQIKSYLQQPTTTSEEPCRTVSFTLPLALAATYDTAAGVGVIGRTGGDKNEKKKPGFPLWTIWLFLALAAVLAVASPWLITKVASRSPKQATAKTESKEFAAVIASQINASGKNPTVTQAPQPPSTKEPVKVRGIIHNGRNKVSVHLTDGRTLTEQSGELKRITRAFVDLINGERLYFVEPLRRDSFRGSGPESGPVSQPSAAGVAPTFDGRRATAGTISAAAMISGPPSLSFPSQLPSQESGDNLRSSARTAPNSGFAIPSFR